MARVWKATTLVAAALATLGCAAELDTERRAVERGSLGEEVYRIACQRIAREAYPNDVSGAQSRALCRGELGAETAAAGRLQALAEQRPQTVEALDRVLPASSEDDLQTLLVDVVPLYDAPTEMLPAQTRELGALLERLGADQDAIDALGRMGARQGMRTTELQLGVVGPALRYPELPTLTRTGLAALAEGGVANDAFLALQGALALELATLEADDPRDAGTLDVARSLLTARRPEFAGGGTGHYVLRDERGLPLPRAIGSNGFVDEDGDGLADVNDEARFVDANGTELFLPMPFATALDARLDTVTRDAQGRAAGEGGLPIYATAAADGTLLAALLREAAPWLEGDTPVAEDAALALSVQLGNASPQNRDFGALSHSYAGFDTSTGPVFELLHATGSLLDLRETRDALTLTQTLLADHEGELSALIDAGLFGDAVADGFPEVALREDNELWDDVLAVTEGMARRPGMLEALLRALADPRSERLGQILAEMARHRDRPVLDAADGGRGTAPLRGQEWSDEVDRSAPDNGSNQSLLQQTLSVMHELNGAEFCNKQDAHMIIRVAGLRIDLMDNALLRTFGLQQEPFDRCELLHLENTTEAYVLSIQGRLDLEPQIRSALPGFLTTLTDIASALGLGGLTLDGILEDNSGIDGLTTRPTPEAMNRLVYSEWNEFLNEMLERPTTIDGIEVSTRHSGNILLAWERRFRFCGDQLLEGSQTCSGTAQNITFYEAFTPLLAVFTDFDPTDLRAGDYIFGELAGALALHYPSAANTMYQESNPNGARFARADNAVAYEPILMQLLGACSWSESGGARTCDPTTAGQMITRLGRLLRVADALNVTPTQDGIEVLAAVTEKLVDSREHPSLRNRAGSRTTQTNSGSRTVDYSPIYLLLEALSDVDDTWVSNEERHTRWLRARSAMVDQLLSTEEVSGDFRLRNRRTYGLMQVVVEFLAERIDEHSADGDLRPWARGLTGRAETTLGGPLGAALVNLLLSMETETEARDAVFGLLSHLLSEDEGGGYDTTLVATQDLLQVLDDDDNLRPLARVLATALAPDVLESLSSGAAIEVQGSMADQSVELLLELARIDNNDTMSELLARLVTPRADDDPSTPLDTLLEVIAEVNRSAPHSGTSYRAADHTVLFNEVRDFMLDPERGLERLYAVVQSREGE